MLRLPRPISSRSTRPGHTAQPIDARRASIRAGLAALDGRPAEALALYADAFNRFRDLGLPVDEALTAIEMATLLDPALPEVRAAAEASPRDPHRAPGPALPRSPRRGDGPRADPAVIAEG